MTHPMVLVLAYDTGEDLAKKVREYHIPDFSNWKHEDDFEKAFADLMRDLRAKSEGTETRSEPER